MPPPPPPGRDMVIAAWLRQPRHVQAHNKRREKHMNRVLRYFCPSAYVQRPRGSGEGPTKGFCPPPPPNPWRPTLVENGGTVGRVG